MKFLFRTNFVSNEYWDGAAYALLTLTTKDLRQIARLKRESVAFLNRMGKILGVSYVGSTNLDLPGHVKYSDDDNADTLSTLLETAGADWMRVPDDFGLPAGVEQADTDHHRLC